jgi:Cu/Ag efflux protein CusF
MGERPAAGMLPGQSEMRTFSASDMKMKLIGAALAFGGALAVTSALAQAPKPERLAGVIDKIDGHAVTAKSDKGDPLKLNLADKTMVVRVEKAALADIKDGDFIGSGAMPQPDGTQKAVEVHIFAESMRGTGEGFGPWTQPGSTMTNGTVGETVTGVSGPVITVKYKGGEQKIVVPPGTPIVKYVIGGVGDIKPGAKFRVLAALKQPDGSFNVSRINVGP